MSLQIIEWEGFLSNPLQSAITVGVFDGLHAGHLELIKKIVCQGPNPTVITFRESPKKIVSPENFEGEIFSLRQKIAAFEKLGLNRVVLIDFSKNFSKLKGREFVELLREPGKMVYLAIGSNFRCGYKQDTGAELIKNMNEREGVPTAIVPPVSLNDGPVSSSRIRSAILAGDLKQAASLMGRNVELDFSDLSPGHSLCLEFCYDLRSVHRIVPLKGHYPVLLYPGRRKATAFTENGKVFLPEMADSIEFI